MPACSFGSAPVMSYLLSETAKSFFRCLYVAGRFGDPSGKASKLKKLYRNNKIIPILLLAQNIYSHVLKAIRLRDKEMDNLFNRFLIKMYSVHVGCCTILTK